MLLGPDAGDSWAVSMAQGVKMQPKGALDHRGYKGTTEEDIRLYYDGYYFTTHLQRRI